jgi:hypothetical protein
MSRPRRTASACTGLFLFCAVTSTALAGCLKVPTDGSDEPETGTKAPKTADEVLSTATSSRSAATRRCARSRSAPSSRA